jgi:hypothetical protein
MLDSKTFPTDEDCHALVANLQFPAMRDRLIADIPGVDEPLQQILFAQTEEPPKWSRIEWAQQLLLHAYTRTSAEHAAPVLTAIGYINWWEGRGSKAHQFLQLALDTDPTYRLARLSDQMIGSGLVAGWNMNKKHRLQNPALRLVSRKIRASISPCQRAPYYATDRRLTGDASIERGEASPANHLPTVYRAIQRAAPGA